MQVNLSEETIKTVYRALRSEKNNLQGMLRRIEVGTASDALQVFEELTQ